jgi:tetratricopeptide (TPR) repeat protein
MLAKSRGYRLLALSFLLSTGASWAQITAIEGDVKGTDGQMVKNAQILIEREDMKGTYKGAKTDKKGHYIYNGLPIGRYTVSVMVDNQKKDEMAHVQTKLGDPVPVNFDLKESAAQAAPTDPGAVTKDQERGMTKDQKDALEKKAKENAAAMAKNKALNDAFNAGKEAFNQKNYDAAVDSFKKGAELDPNQHVIWANLADTYVAIAATKTGPDQQAALDQALDAYQKAIALKQDEAPYHNNYALALAKAKKIEEAKAELTKAAQIDPTQAGKYYYNLGAVLVNTGQTGASEDFFKKAIEADPNYADAQFQYATALSAKLSTGPDGKVIAPAGMQEALNKYLELQPNGQFAEAAKGMLQMIGATIQTDYSKKGTTKKK